mgnify:CR=1 FL=1
MNVYSETAFGKSSEVFTVKEPNMSNGAFIQVVPVHTVGATAECFGNEVPHPMAGYQGIREGFTSGDAVMEIWVEEGAEIPAGFRAL